jgi:HEAT repeat protein
MRYVVSCLCLVALAVSPTLGNAEISDELEKELNKRVDTHLSEGDETGRTAGLLTLGMLGGDEAEKKLEQFKTKDDEDARLAAGMGLTYLDAEKGREFLVEQLQNRSPLYPVLRDRVSLLPDSVERDLLESLVEALEPAKRKGVFRYLARQQGTLYELLGTYATHDDDEMRSQALTAVEATAHPEALEWAERLVQSDETARRREGLEVMTTLSEIPTRRDRAMSALKTALEVDSTSIRLKAAERLFELNDRSASEGLISMLEETDETETRRKIVELMLEYDVAPSTKTISKMRESAEDSALKELLLNLAISAGDDEAMKKVRKMFGTTKFDERLRAARALGYANGEEAVSTLGRALVTEGNAEMRRVAARGLRRIASEQALTPLEKALEQEKKKDIKVEIIRAIGSVGTDEAIQILQFNSTVRDPELKKAIIQAVRDANNPKGLEVLNLFFNARNLELQWRAFVAALDLDPEQAMERAETALRSPPDGFIDDLKSLDASAQKTIFQTLLTHDTPRIRKTALRTVRTFGDDMFPTLRDLLVDSSAPEDMRRRIVTLFSFRPSPDNIPYLEKIARDADSESLARRAAWALTRHDDQKMGGATFRGYFDHDDEGIQAIATYGIAVLEYGSDDEG